MHRIKLHLYSITSSAIGNSPDGSVMPLQAIISKQQYFIDELEHYIHG
jgi:hypothetical protein